MHELNITRNVVAIVGERAQGQQMLRVTPEVGCLSGMFPDAIRFHFDVCSKGDGGRMTLNYTVPV